MNLDILRSISDFYFWVIFAYTETALNGEKSNKSVYISVNNNTN